VRKMGLVLSAAALFWMAVGCASARDAGPKISYDGRAATVCNSVPQWQIKHLCVLPMPRLVAFPERYNGKYIELRGFLVKKFDHVLLFNDRDSIAIFRFYEGVELLNACVDEPSVSREKKVEQTRGGEARGPCRDHDYQVSSDVISALEKGPVPVTVIGLFDSTYQGELSFLGGLKDIKNVAIILDIPEK